MRRTGRWQFNQSSIGRVNFGVMRRVDGREFKNEQNRRNC